MKRDELKGFFADKVPVQYGCKTHTEEFLLEKYASNNGMKLFLLLEQAIPFIQNDEIRAEIEQTLGEMRDTARGTK